jgi:hypothetical protein
MFVHLIFHSALNFALRLYSFRCQVGLRILCEHDDLTYACVVSNVRLNPTTRPATG